MKTETPTIAIDRISLGRRHRKDYGDIGQLPESIEAVGLLHPVVVTPDYRLIAGVRRLRACRKLRHKRIPVHVVDLEKIAQGEYAENAFRKAFTPSEEVAIAQSLMPVERAAARRRQGTRTDRLPGKLPQSAKGRALDKAAKIVGTSRRTLEKAKAVVDAAKKNTRFEKLKEEMDRTGKVDRAYQELRIREQRTAFEQRRYRGARVGDLRAMAKRGLTFSVIYVDAPWDFLTYSVKGKQRSAERHYDVMPLDEIKKLPVPALAAEHCTLFLWATWPELPNALEVIKAWGFKYQTVAFVWVKQNRSGKGLFTGMGYHTRANTEVCLLATKGKPPRDDKGVHQVVLSPVREHSRKPEEVRKRIERLRIGPYLELFAREPVTGWTVWGNEVASQWAGGS